MTSQNDQKRSMSRSRLGLTGSSGHFKILNGSDGIPPDSVAVVALLKLVPPPLVDGLQVASLKELAGDCSSPQYLVFFFQF